MANSSNEELVIKNSNEALIESTESALLLSVKKEIGYPIILFTSDVHLGGGDTLHDEFKQFLTYILLKLNTDSHFRDNLKAIIFLGDVFDMIMDGAHDIVLRYSKIFDLFESIYEHNVKLIFVLGNHEVPVTGNYNKKFEKRLKKLFSTIQEAFTENFFHYKWFNLENFCQYIVLHAKSNDKITLDLLYSIEEYKHGKYVQRLQWDKIMNSETAFKCLGSHGYQFPKIQSQFFGSTVWNLLLNSPDPMKIAVNKIWNESDIESLVKNPAFIDKDAIKKRFEAWKIKLMADARSEESEKKESFRDRFTAWFNNTFKSEKNPIKSFFEKLKEDSMKSDTLLAMISNLMAETQSQFKELINDDSKILDFLKDFELHNVTHVIYGHTHKKGISEKDSVLIYNTGAWQHVSDGSIVCFYENGIMKLF
jgi:UDP-2,3-diacylglucosamine pyrophosphatase LpxH